MTLVDFETEKGITVKESGFKVGDILSGTTHMYRTVTYWFEIISVTEKRMKLRKLSVSYPTKFMSNTPGDQCMPIIVCKNMRYIAEGFPYYPAYRDDEIITASVYKERTVNNRYKDGKWTVESKGEWKYHAKPVGDSFYPTLSMWDGMPGWVNMD